MSLPLPTSMGNKQLPKYYDYDNLALGSGVCKLLSCTFLSELLQEANGWKRNETEFVLK